MEKSEEKTPLRERFSKIAENSAKAPWVPILHRPKIDFRIPKIQLPHRAPHKYIAIGLTLFSAFILAGGIYDIAEQTLPLGFTEAGYQPIYPGINDQFLVESFSIFIFILLGAVGLILIRQATQASTEARPVNFMLTLGIGLFLIGVSASIMMNQIKLGPLF